MKKMKGFTLIELIVVISLMSIFLLIAIPKIGFYIRFNEHQQIRQIKKDILYAKTQAIVKGNIHKFSYDAINNTYSIQENATVIKRVYLKNGLEFSYKGSGTVITFSRTGAPSNGDTINLHNKNKKKYKITITPVVGKVNIKEIK